MGLGRDILRSEAKKAYKQQTKGVLKKNRMPFTKFYQEYKKIKLAQRNIEPTVGEDFDVAEVANVSEVKDTEEKVNE